MRGETENKDFIGFIERGVMKYTPQKISGINWLRPSAVLIPVLRGNSSLLFIKRTMKVKDHKGQIAFPGGVIDREDMGDPVKTALREAEEEVGLPPERVRVIGSIDDTITIAGYLIHPVVGIVDERGIEFRPNPDEVDEILIVKIEDILSADYFEEDSIRWEFHLPSGVVIWGATARILKNLLEVSGLRTFF